MNDLDLPLPEGEEDLLAEFHRIRKEYNKLSKKNPEHIPRRMELKKRYRLLDKCLGLIRDGKVELASEDKGTARAETRVESVRRSSTPFVPLEDVPADPGLASTDPFSTDVADSLFAEDALTTGEGGTSLLEEIIDAESLEQDETKDSIFPSFDESSESSASDAFQVSTPVPFPVDEREDQDVARSMPPLSDVDEETPVEDVQEAAVEIEIEPSSAAEQSAALVDNIESDVAEGERAEESESETEDASNRVSSSIDEISATFLEESAELLKDEDDPITESELSSIGSPFDVEQHSFSEEDAPTPAAKPGGSLPDMPAISIEGFGDQVESDIELDEVLFPVEDVELVAEEVNATLSVEAVRHDGEPVFTKRAKPVRHRRLLGLNGAAIFARLGWLGFLLGTVTVVAYVVPGFAGRLIPVLESAGLSILTQGSNGLLFGTMVMFFGGASVGIGTFVNRGRGGMPSVPLHEIVAGGTPDDIRTAVTSGKSLQESDSRGHNALHAAIVVKRQEMAAVLLELDADIEARTHKGETPLLLAVKGGDLDMAEFLIERNADLNTKSNRESTLMHVAAWAGDVRLLSLLEQKGLDVNQEALTGYTPLHFAAQSGKAEAVRCLLNMNTDMNAMSVKGNTPMYAAARNGHTAVVELLVKAGADPNIEMEQGGHSPLSIAMENGYDDVVAYLKKNGADV